MTRTDIHRPSAINPAEYDFIAVRYDGTAVGDASRISVGALKQISEHMDRTGGKYSTHEHGGSCHVCGAHALYLAIYHHRPTNVYICVGEDCADKMDLLGADFQAIRKDIARSKAFLTGKARAQKELEERNIDARAWAFYETNVRDDFQFEERTIADLVSKLVQYGNLSDKQWAFMIRLIEQIDGRSQKAADRAAEGAASQHIGIIGRRIDIAGVITFVATYETRYGTTFVTGIKDKAGNIYIQKGVAIGTNGEEVELLATVKAHEVRDGVKQTIISRPKVI